MDPMPISVFKARCLAVLERVRKTGRPVLITRRGQPIAQVVPAPPPEPEDAWLGCMRERGAVLGDLLDADYADEWEAKGP